MLTARVENCGAHLRVRTPYSAAFVAELKAGLPTWERSWLPDERCWIVSAASRPVLMLLLSKHFDRVVETTIGPEPAPAETEEVDEALAEHADRLRFYRWLARSGRLNEGTHDERPAVRR